MLHVKHIYLYTFTIYFCQMQTTYSSPMDLLGIPLYTANYQGQLVAFFGSSSAPGNWRLNSGLKIRSSRHHVTWVWIIRGHSLWIQTLENSRLKPNVMKVDGANDFPFHFFLWFFILGSMWIIKEIPQTMQYYKANPSKRPYIFKCVSSLIPLKIANLII